MRLLQLLLRLLHAKPKKDYAGIMQPTEDSGKALGKQLRVAWL